MQLSIIIPVFNAGAYLPPLLARLRALQDVDIEFVLVDDGSTDQSLATLRTWVAEEPRAKLIQQPNAGVAVARNRGLQEANGEYIWFVDADDLPVVSAVDVLLAATAFQPEVIVFNGERFADGAQTGGEASYRQRIYRTPKPLVAVTGAEWLLMLLQQKELRHFVWLHWCRRAYLQSIGLEFLTGISHEDVAWVTEVTLRANLVQYVDVLAYEYRLNAASVTGSADDCRLMQRIQSYFTVVTQLQVLNTQVAQLNPPQPELLALMRGEVVGQALQVFEVAKQLQSAATRAEVMAACRMRRFAQGLWRDALNFKRKRQVITIWRKQQFG